MTTDTQILLALRRAGSGFVSGAELSQRLGLTRAAIWARVEELRAIGYDISANPHQGYKLLDVPDVLCADDLVGLFASNKVVGRDIRVFEKTNSPNDILIRERKVAGVLTELTAELDHVRHLTLGIGVDVNLSPSEFPPDLRKIATSLKIESGRHVSRIDLAAAILRELDRDYARLC